MKKADLRHVISLSVLLLTACAGEENAQRLALKASTGINDLKTHVDTTTGDYQFTRTQDYGRLSELKAVTADIESKTNSRSATWQATEAKSKVELMKIYSTMTPKAALAATAAQILIEPVPPFQPASLDPKKMEALVQKLGVLAKDPTLTERLVATADYLLLVQQSYSDTVKKAKKDPGGTSKVPEKKTAAGALTEKTAFTAQSAIDTADTQTQEVMGSYFETTVVTDAQIEDAPAKHIDTAAMMYRETPLPSVDGTAPSLNSLDITKLRGSDLLTDRLIQNLYLQQ